MDGSVSLFEWGNSDVLSNYSLSYLFGQYIRTQYINDDTIYRDTMNELNQSNNLLSIIAEKLGIKGELWNWRKNDFKSKINDTLMEIAEYLKMNNFRLPIQIRNRTADFLTEMSRRNDVL